MARVGGNPESTLRLLTHVVSYLADAELNKSHFRATAILNVFIGGVTN